MEETLKYLTKRVIDLEIDEKQLLNTNFGLRHTIKDLQEVIKYIYSELKSYYYLSEEAKEELLKYIDEHAEFDLYEGDKDGKNTNE